MLLSLLSVGNVSSIILFRLGFVLGLFGGWKLITGVACRTIQNPQRKTKQNNPSPSSRTRTEGTLRPLTALESKRRAVPAHLILRGIHSI